MNLTVLIRKISTVFCCGFNNTFFMKIDFGKIW